MTDFFSYCPISLGRWYGTPVRIHILFALFVPSALLNAALTKGHPFAQTAGWLALLVLAVLLHELGHAAMAVWLGGEPEEVRLWPLGNWITPTPALMSRSSETIWVALAGPVTSLGLALASAMILNVAADASMVWYPFGNVEGTGAPILASGKVAPAFSLVWWIGWFGFLNLVLFVVNMIPALPMDGGRMLRAVLASPAFGHSKESIVGPHMSLVVAILLLLGGLYRFLFSEHKEGGMTMISLAAAIYLMLRAEARMVEDGGFFDEGVFGYDFSEGYTSLEGSAQKVRPYRESALKRWRRRRSELRRQRRLAREAAEEQRMDEILAKVHNQGRNALTEEEHRFLIRVSAKYRSRPRARE
ncbi:MAG TPA: site-2 protease family protein [Isosphaeraceae bacterium]|nr:site-2 protease family protein [Isosphaeraceae bacterium]